MSNSPHLGPSMLAPEMTYRTDAASQPAFQVQPTDQGQPGLRHLGSTLVRLRTGERMTETIDDYRDIFQELQIDPDFQTSFWTDIIYRYRQFARHAIFLKRGTQASIKNMSDDILRGYGERVWGQNSSWRSGLATGEKMLLYEKNGANEGLHEILAKMWWRMRELLYEEKPKPKPVARKRGRTKSERLRNYAAEPSYIEGDEIYLGDIDDDRDNTALGTDSDAGTSIASSRKARAKTAAKLDKLMEKLPAPEPGQFLTFQQTEKEIMNLIERLHDLRLSSKPAIFERLWLAHIGRIEEIEAHTEPYEITPIGHQVDEEGNPLGGRAVDCGGDQVEEDTIMEDGEEAFACASKVKRFNASTTQQGDRSLRASTDAAAIPFPASLLSDDAIRKRIFPNYSAEPFNTSGNPIPPTLTQKHDVPPTLPQWMSIYIMTSPPRSPYHNHAYHHPGAPVQEQDQVAFFTQVMKRVDHIADKDVKGYALSYGWCDTSRWVEKTVGTGCWGVGKGEEAGESEGERLGWGVFQKDLLEAANSGVLIWRMKVLVVKK